MSKKSKTKPASRKSDKAGEDRAERTRGRVEQREEVEMLPSDTNDSSDISPRIAFLAYN